MKRVLGLEQATRSLAPHVEPFQGSLTPEAEPLAVLATALPVLPFGSY
jgi:hypothetical protein